MGQITTTANKELSLYTATIFKDVARAVGSQQIAVELIKTIEATDLPNAIKEFDGLQNQINALNIQIDFIINGILDINGALPPPALTTPQKNAKIIADTKDLEKELVQLGLERDAVDLKITKLKLTLAQKKKALGELEKVINATDSRDIWCVDYKDDLDDDINLPSLEINKEATQILIEPQTYVVAQVDLDEIEALLILKQNALDALTTEKINLVNEIDRDRLLILSIQIDISNIGNSNPLGVQNLESRLAELTDHWLGLIKREKVLTVVIKLATEDFNLHLFKQSALTTAGIDNIFIPTLNQYTKFLQPSVSSSPEALFYNQALYPGYQRYKPTYRAAILTFKDGDNCTVKLDVATSMFNPSRIDYKPPKIKQYSPEILNINLDGTNKNETQPVFTDVPIRYGNCNGAVFEVDDHVVVLFSEESDGDSFSPSIKYLPKVIGFTDHPVPCVLKGIVFYPTSDTSDTGWGNPLIDAEGNDINPPLGTIVGGATAGTDPLVFLTNNDLKRGTPLSFTGKHCNWVETDEKVLLSWLGAWSNDYRKGSLPLPIQVPHNFVAFYPQFDRFVYSGGRLIATLPSPFGCSGAAVIRSEAPGSNKKYLIVCAQIDIDIDRFYYIEIPNLLFDNPIGQTVGGVANNFVGWLTAGEIDYTSDANFTPAPREGNWNFSGSGKLAISISDVFPLLTPQGVTLPTVISRASFTANDNGVTLTSSFEFQDTLHFTTTTDRTYTDTTVRNGTTFPMVYNGLITDSRTLSLTSIGRDENIICAGFDGEDEIYLYESLIAVQASGSATLTEEYVSNDVFTQDEILINVSENIHTLVEYGYRFSNGFSAGSFKDIDKTTTVSLFDPTIDGAAEDTYTQTGVEVSNPFVPRISFVDLKASVVCFEIHNAAYTKNMNVSLVNPGGVASPGEPGLIDNSTYSTVSNTSHSSEVSVDSVQTSLYSESTQSSGNGVTSLTSAIGTGSFPPTAQPDFTTSISSRSDLDIPSRSEAPVKISGIASKDKEFYFEIEHFNFDGSPRTDFYMNGDLNTSLLSIPGFSPKITGAAANDVFRIFRV